MNSLVINDSFLSLSEQDLYLLNGGEFWTGLKIFAGAVGIGILAVVAAPAVVTIGAAVGVSLALTGASIGAGVGLAEMLGANV